MKITRKQLRQIIKEELSQNLLKERNDFIAARDASEDGTVTYYVEKLRDGQYKVDTLANGQIRDTEMVPSTWTPRSGDLENTYGWVDRN